MAVAGPVLETLARLAGYRTRADGQDRGDDGPPRTGVRFGLGHLLVDLGHVLGPVELPLLVQIHAPILPGC